MKPGRSVLLRIVIVPVAWPGLGRNSRDPQRSGLQWLTTVKHGPVDVICIQVGFWSRCAGLHIRPQFSGRPVCQRVGACIGSRRGSIQPLVLVGSGCAGGKYPVHFPAHGQQRVTRESPVCRKVLGKNANGFAPIGDILWIVVCARLSRPSQETMIGHGCVEAFDWGVSCAVRLIFQLEFRVTVRMDVQ